MHWKDVAPPYGQPSARRLGNEMVPHHGRAERGRVRGAGPAELAQTTPRLAVGAVDGVNLVHTFLADMFSDPKTTAAVVAAIAAFCALGVQLWVGSRQAKIGSRQAEASRISADAAMLTAKSSGNRAVASMRIKWVEDLRGVLSEYHSRLMTTAEFEGADKTLMSNLGTKIDLMLNVTEADQKALWDLADKIYEMDDVEERRKLDKDMMAAARVVLKNEWEKIKRELRGDEDALAPLTSRTWGQMSWGERWRWLRTRG
jgi:hypothetical protein